MNQSEPLLSDIFFLAANKYLAPAAGVWKMTHNYGLIPYNPPGLERHICDAIRVACFELNGHAHNSVVWLVKHMGLVTQGEFNLDWNWFPWTTEERIKEIQAERYMFLMFAVEYAKECGK